jgi:glycosyltransferase involved in cell wall biosynthesis
MNNGGGTEHMTQLLANQLSLNENHKIFVLSKSLRKKETFFKLSENVSLDFLDNAPYRGVLTLLKDVLLLNKYIRKNKIDVLINVDILLGSFSLPLVVLAPKLKQVYWEHFSSKYNIGSKKTDLLRKWALRFGKAYVALTPQDVLEFEGLISKHCRVTNIPNICSTQVVEWNYNSETKKIVSLGHLNNVKGFDMAALVAKKVFEKHPDWTWEVYGDGPEEEKIRKIVLENNLQNNFILKGRTNDLAAVYKDAALMVLTSRTEGFGLVLIEAQAHNLPTVAFDVPFGPRNIIANGQNGYLIEPFDLNKMASKICELIENPDVLKEFSQNASKDVWKYSAQNVATRWENLLGEL